MCLAEATPHDCTILTLVLMLASASASGGCSVVLLISETGTGWTSPRYIYALINYLLTSLFSLGFPVDLAEATTCTYMYVVPS